MRQGHAVNEPEMFPSDPGQSQIQKLISVFFPGIEDVRTSENDGASGQAAYNRRLQVRILKFC